MFGTCLPRHNEVISSKGLTALTGTNEEEEERREIIIR